VRRRCADDRRAVRRDSRLRPTVARAWYKRLLGEPPFFPNATEVVWTLADDRSLYDQIGFGGAPRND